jgi:hypothetical protein
MKWARHIAHMEEMKNAYKNLVSKIEYNRPPWKTDHRYDDNMKIYFREKGCDIWDLIYLTQDVDKSRHINTTVNLCVPQKNSQYFFTTSVTISFLRRTLVHGVIYLKQFSE